MSDSTRRKSQRQRSISTKPPALQQKVISPQKLASSSKAKSASVKPPVSKKSVSKKVSPKSKKPILWFDLPEGERERAPQFRQWLNSIHVDSEENLAEPESHLSKEGEGALTAAKYAIWLRATDETGATDEEWFRRYLGRRFSDIGVDALWTRAESERERIQESAGSQGEDDPIPKTEQDDDQDLLKPEDDDKLHNSQRQTPSTSSRQQLNDRKSKSVPKAHESESEESSEDEEEEVDRDEDKELKSRKRKRSSTEDHDEKDEGGNRGDGAVDLDIGAREERVNAKGKVVQGKGFKSGLEFYKAEINQLTKNRFLRRFDLDDGDKQWILDNLGKVGFRKLGFQEGGSFEIKALSKIATHRNSLQNSMLDRCLKLAAGFMSSSPGKKYRQECEKEWIRGMTPEKNMDGDNTEDDEEKMEDDEKKIEDDEEHGTKSITHKYIARESGVEFPKFEVVRNYLADAYTNHNLIVDLFNDILKRGTRIDEWNQNELVTTKLAVRATLILRMEVGLNVKFWDVKKEDYANRPSRDAKTYSQFLDSIDETMRQQDLVVDLKIPVMSKSKKKRRKETVIDPDIQQDLMALM